jgi:hypothetical protein
MLAWHGWLRDRFIIGLHRYRNKPKNVGINPEIESVGIPDNPVRLNVLKI